MSISQRKLADLAKVSQTTISLALRDDPSVSFGTRQRIKDLANKYRYQRDPALMAVMAQTRHYATTPSALALIIGVEPEFFQVVEPFHQFTFGVEKRCRELGFFLDRFWLNDPTLNPVRQAAMLEARGVNGIILLWGSSDKRIPAIYAPLYERFACAVIGSSPSAPHLHVAMPDHYAIGEVAFEHALAAGFRRPTALIAETHDAVTGHRLSLGCLAAQKKLHLAHSIPPLVEGHNSARIFPWLEKHRPDFLLVTEEQCNDVLAPLDLDPKPHLYHWDITPRLHHKMSGINQNTQMIGAAGVDLVVGQIHRNERGVPAIQKQVLIAGEHSERVREGEGGRAGQSIAMK